MGNKNLLKQAQQLQARMAKAQEELASSTVEAVSGGGAVRVVVTGQHRIQAVEIDPAAVDPQDVELLQDMVQAAVNEGLEKSDAVASQRMAAITGGMKIPGLM